MKTKPGEQPIPDQPTRPAMIPEGREPPPIDRQAAEAVAAASRKAGFPIPAAVKAALAAAPSTTPAAAPAPATDQEA